MKVSGSAYAKLVLHAAKHTGVSVDGLLLGKRAGNGIEIVDAVPLFHKCTLAPALEFATAVVTEYAEKQGLVIVGYYVANELADDHKLPEIAKSIGSTLSEKDSTSAVLLLLDAGKVRKPKENALCAFRYKSGEWREVQSSSADAPKVDPSAVSRVVSMLNSDDSEYNGEPKWFEDLVDFDDHLEDLQKDWRCVGISFQDDDEDVVMDV
eukprot:g559.t1